MKMKKSLLTVSLAAAMLLSACTPAGTASSGTAERSTADSGTSSAAVSTTESTTSAGETTDGPLTPFAEKVTVNVMREVNPDVWFPEGEDFENNVLTKYYEEKLNIDYVIKWKVERGRMKEQLDLAIASDDIPDMFEASLPQINRLARAGQIQALDDPYEKYVSDNMRDVLEYNDKMFFKPAMYDDKLYGLPETNDYADNIPILWLRQDWLDKLNKKAPTTYQEFLDLAKAFMEADMDGNGKKDTIGLSLDKNLGLTFQGLVSIFGLSTDSWVPDSSGKLVYADTAPEMKDVLSKLQVLYTDGIIDKEFAVKDGTKMTELVAAEKCGMAIGAFWYPLGDALKAKQTNDNAVWQSYPMPKDYEGDYKMTAKSACSRYLVVNKNFKHPEAAIKGNNLWYELWRGENAEYYHGLNLKEYNKAGEDFKNYPPFWFDPPLKNRDQSNMVFPAWDTRDVAKITHPETKKQWDKMVDYYDNKNKEELTGWAHLPLFDSFQVIEKNYGQPENLIYDAYQGPMTQSIANIRPLVDKVRLEELTKFLMGADLGGFDKYVETWNNVGGTQFATEVNEWYAANK